MRTLAAVDTVHTAAAICDYLDGRLDDADEVVAVTIVPEGASADVADGAPNATPTPGSDADRDGQEALNVTSVRLAGIDVAPELRHGEPAGELLAAAADHDVDEVVVGARSGVPDGGDGAGSKTAVASDSAGADPAESPAADGLGSTAAAVLAGVDRPVVVLPLVGL